MRSGNRFPACPGTRLPVVIPLGSTGFASPRDGHHFTRRVPAIARPGRLLPRRPHLPVRHAAPRPRRSTRRRRSRPGRPRPHPRRIRSRHRRRAPRARRHITGSGARTVPRLPARRRQALRHPAVRSSPISRRAAGESWLRRRPHELAGARRRRSARCPAPSTSTAALLAALVGRARTRVSRRRRARTTAPSRAGCTRTSPLWNLVGRVYFHLAENRDDPDSAVRVPGDLHARASPRTAKVQHVPLGARAARVRRRGQPDALLSLLVPVQRAAETSALVARAAGRRGEIFAARCAGRPPRRTASCTRSRALEAAGLVVRVPDWWTPRRPPRPQVQVTSGRSAPARARRRRAARLRRRRHARRRARSPPPSCARCWPGRGLVLSGAAGSRSTATRSRRCSAHGRRSSAPRRRRHLVPRGDAPARRRATSAGDAAPTRPTAASSAWSPGAWLATTLAGAAQPRGLAAADPGDALQRHAAPLPAGRRPLAVLADAASASAAASPTTWGSARPSR